jgi:type IV pilus assembly protein PilC
MKGTMEAPNVEAVVAQLKKQNIAPTVESIKEKKGPDLSMSISFGSGVSEKDLVVFTRQFATMIDAGLPLVQCLDILSRESPNIAFRKILANIKESVEAGTTLAEGLRKHPKVFNELYCNMVAAGEAGGILDTVLNRLAVTIEKAAALKRQIKGAMMYPAITLTVAVAVVAILMIFVIPQFAQLFKDMGAELPALTKFVMGLSTWMAKQFGWAIMLGVFGGVFAIWWGMQQNKQTEMMLHRFYLMIPALGDVIRKSAVASFTRILGTLISSGVPIMDGLDIVARIAGNRVVEAELRKVKQAISEGKTLSEPLKASKVFPAMVVQMIGVGEQTGALDAMLQKIADFYEVEVDEAVETLTGLLEPIIMMFLAVVAGGVVISMYLPIFSLASVVSGGG